MPAMQRDVLRKCRVSIRVPLPALIDVDIPAGKGKRG